MIKGLKIVLFGCDLYSLKTGTTLIEILNRAEYQAKLTTVIPPLHSQLPEQTPMRIFLRNTRSKPLIYSHIYHTATSQLSRALRKLKPDYGIICDPFYDKKWCKYFSKRLCLAQPSILPNFAGPDAIPHTILSRVKNGGLTITDVNPKKKLYENSIIYQELLPLKVSEDYVTLSHRLGIDAGTILSEIIQEMERGNGIDCIEPTAEPIKFKRLSRVFSVIRSNAALIVRFHRALQGDNYTPVTPIKVRQNLLIASLRDPMVYKGVAAKRLAKEPPGTVYWNFKAEKTRLLIRCKEGVLSTIGLKTMDVYYSSRILTAKSIVEKHISHGKKKRAFNREGKALLFCDTSEFKDMKKYHSFIDKRFRFIA
eukprot:TRINITY_DN1124_c0_g2_i1.p1 TRINITY_DN1124_c0_g2~~TRINITY_DN1124_c0_g2_i1.p1  ORF type:complete len:367 (+),score=54.13 TRINITY_DN1124_c0_g2_i1:1096-2196(+)